MPTEAQIEAAARAMAARLALVAAADAEPGEGFCPHGVPHAQKCRQETCR